jgi:K+-transporting ATPase KdpC subunit
MFAEFRPAFVMLIIMTALTGGLYPAVVTGIAQLVFPSQANGSLIEQNGKAVGSSLIGQPFSDPKHFWSRPSATVALSEQCELVERLQPGALESRFARSRRRPHQSVARSGSR